VQRPDRTHHCHACILPSFLLRHYRIIASTWFTFSRVQFSVNEVRHGSHDLLTPWSEESELQPQIIRVRLTGYPLHTLAVPPSSQLTTPPPERPAYGAFS